MSAIMATIFGIASRSTTATQIPGSQEGSGALWVWGLNLNGRLGLGLGDTIYRSSPVQLGVSTNWSKVSSGSFANFGIKTDGTLWAWGANSSGFLGLNDRENRGSPVQVGTNANWNNIYNTFATTLATKTDGTLWSWGTNNAGHLGLNVGDGQAYRSSPVQIGTDTNWNIISTTSSAAAGIKTDGTLWTWGGNETGQLLLNNVSARSSPTQVGAESWLDVCVGPQHSAAIRADGTLWACGSNYSGELGINTRFIHRSSPVQVGTNTNWSNVKLLQGVSFATKTDGTLWVWGQGARVFGLNFSYGSRSSPTQIGANANWSFNKVKISSASQALTSIKTDGTLWTWGNNDYGQLGLNSVSFKSSPTQVGASSNWSSISVGAMGLGIKQI